MIAPQTIIDFIDDPALLGPFFAGPSWDRWRAVLKAAFALPMNYRDVELFDAVAGGRKPPPKAVDELDAICGRGSGKDSIAAALAAYVAVTGDFSRLRPGERGSILCLATDRDQAGIAFNYIKGLFEQVPLLAGLVERVTADTIDLSTGASITVATNSFRGTRGRTVCLAIYDECAFWRSDDFAAPDVEVDAAISPGLARWPGSLKIMISSAYRRQGLLYQRWREAFGVDDDDTLCVVGDTLAFNPGFDRRVIERELARDPERASAEYLCRWRDDLVSFIDRAAVEACVVNGCHERGPVAGVKYQAFTDPSGGRGDSFTLAIAHNDTEGRAVLDCLREVKPPFSPDGVVAEFAALLRQYGISEVIGDNYGGAWPQERFIVHEIAYRVSEQTRSALYLEMLPLINSGRIELLDNPRLINQICALERRVERSGRESVNHPDGGHDDLSNAAAGALVAVAGTGGAPLQCRGTWLNYKRRAEALEASAVARDIAPKPVLSPAFARIYGGAQRDQAFNPVIDRGPSKNGTDNRTEWRRNFDQILDGRRP
jgi:hypothetical protein